MKSELERAVDDDALVGDIVANYQKLADGRQTVCYCVSRKHSEHTAAKFRAAGISAAHVDGETHKAERDRIISDFRRKKLRVLCNVDLLGEGFDVPGMEAVILARQTLVRGAIGMVAGTVVELEKRGIVAMSEPEKAKLVTNMMTVLLSEENAAPVLNVSGD